MKTRVLIALFGAVIMAVPALAQCDATVNPEMTPAQINNVLAANPSKTVCFAHGRYRISSPLYPAQNQKLIGMGRDEESGVSGEESRVSNEESRVILDGSKLISPHRLVYVSRNVWYANDHGLVRDQCATWGLCFCQDGSNTCGMTQDVFMDGSPMKRVGEDCGKNPVVALQPTAAGPPQYCEDYTARRLYIYLPDNYPANHRVERSDATAIITVCDPTWKCSWGVTVDGFIVQRAANMAESGAIHENGESGWTVQNNEARYNHGVGIYSTGSLVQYNNMHHNGMGGLGGYYPTPVDAVETVQYNEIGYNDTAGYSTFWGSGGAKFAGNSNASTYSLIFRGNYVHDNIGNGFWCDIDCYNIDVENNTFTGNDWGNAIEFEISKLALIQNNVIDNTGHPHAQNALDIHDSESVEVRNNTGVEAGFIMYMEPRSDSCVSPIDSNPNSPDGLPYCPYTSLTTGTISHLVRNNYIHDNTTIMHAKCGYLTGEWEYNIGGDPSIYSQNNVYAHNTYYAGALDPSCLVAEWNNTGNTWGDWTKPMAQGGIGQDHGSTLLQGKPRDTK